MLYTVWATGRAASM